VADEPGQQSIGPTQGVEPAQLVEEVLADRRLTVPNVLSVLRLLGVPLFLWLLLGPHADGWALVVLIVSGFTDWLDGKLARWLNQLSTITAFAIRDIIPWWVFFVLVARDVLVAVCIWVLGRAGFAPPEVTYIGKAATFCLMYAFPLLLVGLGGSTFSIFVSHVATAFAVWGGVLFVWSGLLYTVQTRAALRGSSKLSAGNGAAEGVS
jgi:cardiolipin synthase